MIIAQVAGMFFKVILLSTIRKCSRLVVKFAVNCITKNYFYKPMVPGKR